MNERRRFLRVIGASVASVGASSVLAACSASAGSGGGFGTTTAGAAGSSGAGGLGGAEPAGTGQGGSVGTGGSAGTGGSVGTGGQGQGGQAGACTQSPTGNGIGAPAAYAAHGLYKVSAAKAIVGRDADGLYAMSASCTHSGCGMSGSNGQLTANATEVVCLCHGSIFDADGNAIQGPAYTPLPHVSIELGCDGQLYVDRKKQVAVAFRLSA